MNAGDDFLPSDPSLGLGQGSNYPTLLGITLTPVVGGVIFAVLGLGSAAYLWLNIVQPVVEKQGTLKTSFQEKQDQIQQKQLGIKKIAQAEQRRAEAKKEREQVLALFSNEKTLDTLLLDLNNFVSTRNAQLIKFEPLQQAQRATTPTDIAGSVKGVVNDNSLGPDANGKVKRKVASVELEGGFDQIQSIMRNIERLQSLVVVKDFRAELGGTEAQKFQFNPQGKAIVIGAPRIRTSFKLEALMPLTSEETAAIAAATAPPPAATPPK